MRRGWTWHLGLGREVGYIFWGMACLEAAFGAYFSIWPLWIEALGAPIVVVGFVLGSSGLLRLVVLAPSAALAERFDPRTLVVASRTLAGLGLVTAALATHWTQLAPMVLGMAAGELAFPVVQSILASQAGEDRVRAFTLVFNVGPAAAFGVSPLIAGALVAAYGMRAAFLLAAVFTIGSVWCFLRLSRRPPAADGPAPVAATYRATVAEPAVRATLVLHFATIFALSLGVSLLPTFLADVRGFSPATVAVLGSVGSIGSVGFGLAVARSRTLQQAPFAASTVAVLAVAVTLAVSAASPLTWLIVVAFAGRGGLFTAWGLFIAAMGEVVRDGPQRGRAFALAEMVGGTAFFSAPILSGQLYAVAPVLPLLVAIGGGLLMVPVLLLAQRRFAANVLPVPTSPVEPEIA